MNQKEIAKTFVDAPTPIGEISLPRFGKIGRLLRLTKRVELKVYGLPIGKVQLIGAKLYDMAGEQDVDKLSTPEKINHLLKHNLPMLIEIIGLAVCKGSKMPSKALLDAISSQMTMEQLADAFSEVYRRLDLTNFFNILGLAKNLSLIIIQDKEAHGQS